ncbi:hypothetical protein LTR53_012321 [Teratosphaeriaceae sp. CCFEE 6253]|nr:hypothetical protein LTR53_012321 [Teratosphaeriaceae sp. CCFEE 6253]
MTSGWRSRSSTGHAGYKARGLARVTMGIMDKIEGKLHSGKKTEAGHSQPEQPLYSDKERKSIEQQSAPYGSGTGHSGQMTDNTSDATRSHDLRHPIQTATGNEGPGHYGQSGSSGLESSNQNYRDDGYGDSSSRDKTHALDPVNPHSIGGQDAMYKNSGRSDGRDYSGRDDHDAGRSHQGGIPNPMSSNQYGSGGRSSNENYNAIPTAGGERLGDPGSGSDHHGGHGQSHGGRDAALGAGAGALGMEEYERHKQQSSGRHGHHGLGKHDQPNDRYGNQGLGSNNQQDRGYPQYAGRSQQSDGVAGSAGYGDNANATRGGHGVGNDTYNQSSNKHHGIGHHNDTSSGMTTEKKLGGAYEAGYRDAMQHLEAERQRQ